MAEQGICTYAGWPIIGGEMTLSRGVRPSSCLLRVLPAANLTPTVNTLSFAYGAVGFSFANAAVDATTLRIGHGRDGWRWAVKVYDRRWKWRYPTIVGLYNSRLCDGTLQEATKKNIKELIELLLGALGESGYEITGVPEDVYPYVAWNRHLAAPELEHLCDLIGCVVALGTDNKVHIAPLGSGQQLPPGLPNVNPIFKSKPAVMPSAIRFVAGPTIYQKRLLLEAVGLDTDGTIKLIDQLSYKPSGGWDSQWHNAFPDVAQIYRHLAFATVWRWYRVTNPNDYQIYDTAAEAKADDTTRKRCMASQIQGVHWPHSDHAVNTPSTAVYAGPFTVLRDKRIIEFEYPVIKWVNNRPKAADLYWIGAYSLVGSQDSSLKNYTLEQPVQQAVLATEPRELHHPEVFQVEVTDSVIGAGPSSNIADVASEAQSYVQKVVDTYAYDPAEDVLYEGLRDISPDGAIAQVRWICGHGRPALTRAGRNIEFDTWAPHHQQRRAHERAIQADELRAQYPVAEMARDIKLF